MEDRTSRDVVQVSSSSKVDLNNLMKRVRDEEKKSKRASVYVSAAAVSAFLDASSIPSKKEW